MSDNEQPINHPVENVLDLEEGTTVMPTLESESSAELALQQHESYDEKDHEIEQQFQQVYSSAMSAFERQEEDNQVIEPKYRARNQEVAVQYLNTALNAAKEKKDLKQNKDKTTAKKQQGPNTVNNNVVVADRNDLLRDVFNHEANQNTNNGETYETE